MPVKYKDRLNLNIKGNESTNFYTKNGLLVAKGYNKVLFKGSKPFIEFQEKSIISKNIKIPENQIWRTKNNKSDYVEFRSKDYCNVKIVKMKSNSMFYISPFDLSSDDTKNLIDPLFRQKTKENLK